MLSETDLKLIYCKNIKCLLTNFSNKMKIKLPLPGAYTPNAVLRILIEQGAEASLKD